MDRRLFERFCDIAYERAGIRLKEGKESLVEARVAKRLRDLGLGSAQEYLTFLVEDDGEELVRFLDVISTNFTSFFREADHFDILARVARERFEQGRARLRFWSCASSTGEEPYTMAMTLAETIGTEHDWRILATDISTRVLERAASGVYDEAGLGSVPRHLRAKYFEAVGGGRAGRREWRVKSALRERIVFKRLNLSTPPFPMGGPLDVVFCRNVMIYFDQPVRQRLIAGIERLLGVDGWLLTGHSETLSAVSTRLGTVSPSVYTLDAAALPARRGQGRSLNPGVGAG